MTNLNKSDLLTLEEYSSKREVLRSGSSFHKKR